MRKQDPSVDPTRATEALTPRPASVEGCRLVVVEGDDQGAAFDLAEGSAIIGKSASCQLRLSDGSVSAQHLRIEVTPLGLRVADLGSTNGTFYLGSRLEQAVLPTGAVLSLGRTRLALSSREPPRGAGYSDRSSYGEIVGSAPVMRRLYALLERIEPTDYTVLIHGETGTGKELVARAIHDHSARTGGPYEILDCTSMPPDLAESLLFGHVKGAFTGATSDRLGSFQRADGGTLFLDELGELRLDLQPKLLRALESGKVQRVGDGRLQSVDVRVVAATNRDLGAEVDAGRFREDLYYRLNVVTLELPPLRERREDIPGLVRHFVSGPKQQALAISAETLELFTCGYDWPGNVRELRNAIASVLSLGEVPERLRQAAPEPGHGELRVDHDEPFVQAKKRLVDAFERDYLQGQLDRADGNMAKAARLASVDRAYFKRLLKRHGLSPEREED
ncbi:MAG: sigma 54-interacting transcriptional regulator [Pseudomonadota bacterium]